MTAESPRPVPADPRSELRDRIAENEGKRRNGAASDGRGWYRTEADREDCYAVADAVMELFPGPIAEDWDVRGTSPGWGEQGWVSYKRNRDHAMAFVREKRAQKGCTAQAFRSFALRTAPEPIGDET